MDKELIFTYPRKWRRDWHRAKLRAQELPDSWLMDLIKVTAVPMDSESVFESPESLSEFWRDVVSPKSLSAVHSAGLLEGQGAEFFAQLANLASQFRGRPANMAEKVCSGLLSLPGALRLASEVGGLIIVAAVLERQPPSFQTREEVTVVADEVLSPVYIRSMDEQGNPSPEGLAADDLYFRLVFENPLYCEESS